MNLPGTEHRVSKGATCEECDAFAVVGIQGETDSFGCEIHELCAEHAAKYRAEAAQLIVGACDWCKTGPLELKLTRDYDEGDSGPVYRVCAPCRAKQTADAAAELEWMRQQRGEELTFDDEFSGDDDVEVPCED